MKQLLALILLCSGIVEGALAQEKFEADTVVKGRVYTMRGTKVYPVEAELTIHGTDGRTVTTFTDKEGNYYFSNNQIPKEVSFVITSGSGKRGEDRFLNKVKKFTTVEANEEDLPFTLDFEVDFFRGCRGLIPLIFFERNSSDQDDLTKRDIEGLVWNLRDNPTIVLEIGGRANSDELNPFELAAARAQTVYDALIEAEVNPERIITKNYGDTIHYVADWHDYDFGYRDTLSPEYIKTLTDSAIIEQARILNSSVQIRVTRNDYVPKIRD